MPTDNKRKPKIYTNKEDYLNAKQAEKDSVTLRNLFVKDYNFLKDPNTTFSDWQSKEDGESEKKLIETLTNMVKNPLIKRIPKPIKEHEQKLSDGFMGKKGVGILDEYAAPKTRPIYQPDVTNSVPPIAKPKPNLVKAKPKLEPIKPLGIKPIYNSLEPKLAGNVIVPEIPSSKNNIQNYTGSKALQIQGKPSGYINKGNNTGRQEFRKGGWLDGLDNNKYVSEKDATSTVKTPAIATNNNAFKEKVYNPDKAYKYAIDAAGTVFYPASLAGSAIDFYQGDNVGGVAGLVPFGKGYKFLKNAKAIAAGAGASKSAKKFTSGVNKIMGAHIGTQVYDAKSDLIDPLMKDKKKFGGSIDGLDGDKTEQAPDVTNATEYVKGWYNSPMYDNILRNQIADAGIKSPRRTERIVKRYNNYFNKDLNNSFYDVTPSLVDDPSIHGEGYIDNKGNKQINLNKNFVQKNPKLVNSLYAHELTHDNLMTFKDREYINKNTPEYNPALHKEDTYNKLTDPEEVRSQIHSIRQLSGENKIYDPLTQPFKKEYLDKVNESYNQGTKESEDYNQLQRLRQFYSDDQITEMMNTITKSNSNNGKVYAKNGGWLDGLTTNKFDMGGTIDEEDNNTPSNATSAMRALMPAIQKSNTQAANTNFNANLNYKTEPTAVSTTFVNNNVAKQKAAELAKDIKIYGTPEKAIIAKVAAKAMAEAKENKNKGTLAKTQSINPNDRWILGAANYRGNNPGQVVNMHGQTQALGAMAAAVGGVGSIPVVSQTLGAGFAAKGIHDIPETVRTVADPNVSLHDKAKAVTFNAGDFLGIGEAYKGFKSVSKFAKGKTFLNNVENNQVLASTKNQIEKKIAPWEQDNYLNKFKNTPIEEQYSGVINNKEINEKNKDRIISLAEHWAYENPADRIVNQKVQLEISDFFKKQKAERSNILNFSRKAKSESIEAELKILDNDVDAINANVKGGNQGFIDRVNRKAKQNPNYRNKLLEEKRLNDEAMAEYGDEYMADLSKDINKLTEVEKNEMHLRLKARQEETRKELDALKARIIDVKLNPDFKSDIENLYKLTGTPLPSKIEDAFSIEKGIKERNRIVYPRLLPESMDDLGDSEKALILKQMETSYGFRGGQNTYTFGEEENYSKNVVGIYDVIQKKAPFKLNDISTWSRKKIINSLSDEPSKIVKQSLIQDVAPADVQHTVGHEIGHDLQEFGNWKELITKYDGSYKYYTNHSENEISKLFQEHMVEPTAPVGGKSTYETWKSGMIELDSDLKAEVFKIADKLHPDPKIAIKMFRKNKDKHINDIVDSKVLDKFFKPNTPTSMKQKLTKILPVFLIGAGVKKGFQQDKKQNGGWLDNLK